MSRERTAELPVPLFHRLLYLSYRRGARLSHFITQRVSPGGWLGVGLLVLTAVLGSDVSRSSLYQIFALVFALLAVAVLWAWCRRARLSAVRRVPRYATAGESFSYTVEVRNDGRHAVREFLLCEQPPDPRPPLRTFAFTPEPGEEKRNIFDRVFIYYRWRWLLEQRLLFKGGTADRSVVLKSGESTHVRMTLEPRRRGIVRLARLRAGLPDPFGLFRRCRRVTAPADSVIVLPRRYRLPAFKLPGEACFQLGGEAVSNTIGQSGEFLGLRDYRSGDALRHIHWKGWAKVGRPIVKEFEDVYFPRYGLVLDNFTEHGDDELFEEAVSVAASFASGIDTRRNLLDLMFIKDEAIIVTAGRGEAKAEKLLEVLAAVEAEREADFEALEHLVQSHRDDLTACICVFTGWTPERARFLRRLVRGGLETLALILCRQTAELAAALADDPLPCRHVLLEPPRVQEGLLKL